MPVTIEHHIVIAMGGKAGWKVKPHQVVAVGESQFVRLQPTDGTLVRMLCDGMLGDNKLPKNPTLATCPGFRELQKLRNEQQRVELQADVPACGLFEQGNQEVKKVRRTAAAVKELRENPQMLHVQVVGEGQKTMVIDMVRPVHPCDDLAVRLDSEMLEFIFDFIRHRGISADLLQATRAYASSGSDGVWKFGDGFVVKVKAEDGAKYKRAKTVEQAVEMVQAMAGDGEA